MAVEIKPSGAEVHRLDGVALLVSLKPEELRNLERRCRWRRCARNEQILDKDSDDRDVYFVVKGAVQIVNYSLTGREVALARVGAGGYFGELSAIDGRPRSASVVAAEDCVVATASPRTFTDLLADHPPMAQHVLQRLAGIIRSCDERIMDLSTLGAVQRVYLELLRLIEEPKPGSCVIPKLPTHKTIASRASTTRETVARTISQLNSAGILEREGDAVIVRERHKLEDLATALDVELSR
jgi:CRP-like cAMP-binding protein